MCSQPSRDNLKRELQNSLCRPNLMILTSVRFLANQHILLAIGDLREIRIRRQKRKFGPKWSFATPSTDVTFVKSRSPKFCWYVMSKPIFPRNCVIYFCTLRYQPDW